MTLDPNKALSQFVGQWLAQKSQQKYDLSALYGSIFAMMQMMQTGNVQEAFQYAGMVVMTNSMQCLGDDTGEFAGAENLATGIRNISGDLQNIFSEGNTLNATDAGNFVKWLNEFWNGPNELNGGKACPSWMDSADYGNIVNSIKNIYSEFGVGTADYGKMTTANFINKMKSFFPANQTKTPNPAVTALQGDFQTLNNSVSAISSSATASEQYWTNVYNQAQGVTNNILQTIGQFNSNIVANQKSN